jgi:hypothetical protein
VTSVPSGRWKWHQYIYNDDVTIYVNIWWRELKFRHGIGLYRDQCFNSVLPRWTADVLTWVLTCNTVLLFNKIFSRHQRYQIVKKNTDVSGTIFDAIIRIWWWHWVQTVSSTRIYGAAARGRNWARVNGLIMGGAINLLRLGICAHSGVFVLVSGYQEWPRYDFAGEGIYRWFWSGDVWIWSSCYEEQWTKGTPRILNPSGGRYWKTCSVTETTETRPVADLVREENWGQPREVCLSFPIQRPSNNILRFNVIISENIKVAAFCYVMACILIDTYCLPNYTASHPINLSP